jgi:uncharacterized membrane protein
VHRSTRWLVALIVLLALIPLPLVFGYRYPLFLPYAWHKALHIAGVLLLLGNVMVSAVWMVSAERSRSAAVLRFSAQVVNWLDVFFTAPGAILVLGNGLPLASQWGGVTHTPWIQSGLALFLVSGAIWVGVLIPDQHRMIRLSEAANPEEPLPPAFFRCLHRWYFWGTIAILLLLVALGPMVGKIAFWG